MLQCGAVSSRRAACVDAEPSAAIERRVTCAWKDGAPTLVHKMSVDGITPEEFHKWCENYFTNVQVLAPPNVTYKELGHDGGCKIICQRIDPQVIMISARSIMTAAYMHQEDDELIFILSSKGNQHLEEQHKDVIGKDVIGTLHINFMSFKPKLDSCGDAIGTELVQCYSMSPNGSLPQMVVDKLIAKQQDSLIMIRDMILKNRA